MIPITQPASISRCQDLLNRMMLWSPERGYEFRREWVRQQAWAVVPVESMARLPRPDIPRIATALKRAGRETCIAIATESVEERPACYTVEVNEADFLELNRQLGPFRFVLTDAIGSWAISCNEWYNLFAGKPELVEALLGEPIESAEQKFQAVAALLADGDPSSPLLSVVKQYAG
jgi:hypothetical protein